MDVIVKRVLDNVPDQHRALIGIDGVDASGKSTFAAALARGVSGRPVELVHLYDFLNPSTIRHRRGRVPPRGSG